MPVTWVAWAMVPSTPARIRYFRCQASLACPARAAVRASWIWRCRKPSWRPERTAVVHRARAGHGWHVAVANRAMMMFVPLLRAGVQELDTWPSGQVTCLFSQSMVNMAAVYPPERACGELSGGTGASRVMPRARAASSRSALAYPLSAACSPGGRPRRASAWCTGSVISTSVTGASVVSVLVIRFGAGRRPAASGTGQVSDRCTLYPVQPLPRFSAYRALVSCGETSRDLAGGRPGPPPDHLLPARAGL